jgi:hypothetical protein
MATQQNLDVVSNKYTYFQSVLMNITSHRTRFFYFYHYYRIASASLNMYEFIEEDLFFSLRTVPSRPGPPYYRDHYHVQTHHNW